jgi:hypothetical protein
MAWTEIATGDRIADICRDDGSHTVELTTEDAGGETTTYTSNDVTIADGAMRAKFAMASGGASVKAYFEANGNTITGIKYELTK